MKPFKNQRGSLQYPRKTKLAGKTFPLNFRCYEINSTGSLAPNICALSIRNCASNYMALAMLQQNNHTS